MQTIFSASQAHVYVFTSKLSYSSTVTSNHLQGFLRIFGELAPPSLNCPVVQPLENLVPGLIGTTLSAVLQLCAPVTHYCLLASTSQ